MAVWISIPILVSLAILQTSIFSRVTLLHGTADLVMLAVIAWTLQKKVTKPWFWGFFGGLLIGFISAVPIIVPILSMVTITGLGMILKQRVWQVPILAMFLTTFFGTIISNILTLIALRITGLALPVNEVLFSITLPSILLNLVIAVPMYYLIRDLARWIYPENLEA